MITCIIPITLNSQSIILLRFLKINRSAKNLHQLFQTDKERQAENKQFEEIYKRKFLKVFYFINLKNRVK